ncbi:MAG: fructose-1,6-bisphosphatase [Clostridia bacterium]
MDSNYDKKKYLTLLSKEYKNIHEVAEEIINLQAIINLPKGTEMFLSDIHGEYAPFEHILNNGGGIIKSKIDDIFGNTITKKERATLATLIYYPEEKLKLMKKEVTDLNEWYNITLYRLVEVAKKVSSKYTRSKVRKAITSGFEYVIDELLNSQAGNEKDKERYYKAIINTIIQLNQADSFIIAISDLIKRMATDHLHIVGDIFDRGTHPDFVIEKLKKFHSMDIQWGNHDVLWMGATCGNEASIATVVRICARYNNIGILEDGYGINIRPLATFAMETYKEDNCKNFLPKVFDESKYDNSDKMSISKIHKAITIIQFKLEGQIIKRHPEYHLENRLLLDKINLEKGYVLINGKKYEINDTNFPTLDKENIYELTQEEKEVMERLCESFKKSPRLNDHIDFLYKKGELYTIFNSNLLFHACIPMTEEGEFKKVEFLGKQVKGKEYFDLINETISKIWYTKQNVEKDLMDIMWYLWISPDSPFFGKDKMATFESYFVKDKDMSKEAKNPYYYLTSKEEICDKILKEFGLDEKDSHIVNGHIPVKAKDGESPIRGNGKLLVIDGGFAKSYQQKTGNAGYILTYNSNGLLLSQNKPFESVEKAILEEKDIISELIVKKKGVTRKSVGDTDIGKKLKSEIKDLEELLLYYESGELK